MKKLIYVISGLAWVGFIFFKPVIKDINKVNVVNTTLVNLMFWPVCMGVALFNHFTGKEVLWEKNEESAKT